MFASLALLSLLQPTAVGADGLSIADARLTYGPLGPARTEASVRPGDSVHLSFTIRGIATTESGAALYTTAVEVTDAGGKVVFHQPDRKFQEFLPLGGGTVPGFAQLDLGQDIPAGDYTMKVTVTDNAGGKTATTTQKVKVLPKAFDIVRVHFAGDVDALVPVGAYAVGQPLWFHAGLVGFTRAADGTKQPNVSLTLRVLDESGKPLVSKPFSGSVKGDVPAADTILPIRFFVPLNRAGTYTIEVSATDELGKKSATKKFPLVVVSKN